MSARYVLLLIVTAFLLTALLLVYNGFYRPISVSGTEPPSLTDQIR